jgi:hypothetical protein
MFDFECLQTLAASLSVRHYHDCLKTFLTLLNENSKTGQPKIVEIKFFWAVFQTFFNLVAFFCRLFKLLHH